RQRQDKYSSRTIYSRDFKQKKSNKNMTMPSTSKQKESNNNMTMPSTSSPPGSEAPASLFPGSNAALIGYTGHVGSNLTDQYSDYRGYYNSKNIDDLSMENYETVVCAAATGFKLGANSLKQDVNGNTPMTSVEESKERDYEKLKAEDRAASEDGTWRL
ncbi:unnamed protein product, partial [Amoebophrya sp. A25]